MPIITLYLPKMGESVLEASVLNWPVQEGSSIREGTPLLEVATDKVDVEVPAPYNGTIKKILVTQGAVIAIGAPIALLEIEGPASQSADESSTKLDVCNQANELPKKTALLGYLPLDQPKKLPLTPLVQQISSSHALPLEELERLAKNSKTHRLTKKMLINYLSQQEGVSHPNIMPVVQEKIASEDTVIEMDRVRKLIAQRMVQSKRIAPHVTSFIRADVTQLVDWRNQMKASFYTNYAIHLTYFPIFMAATARALRAFPLLNAIVSGDKIILKKQINIGFAIALKNGNLVVPVVKGVESLNLVGLTQRIHDLIEKAYHNTLAVDDISGGSYTLSNIGSFDNLMGTPIIMQPQVAILAIGAIKRRPAVITVAGKEEMAIRDEVFLSHTYDHRVIDGAVGGNFLKHMAQELAHCTENGLLV